MDRSQRRVEGLLATMILASCLWVRSAKAEDCAPIIKAEEATLVAPGFRQYLVPPPASGGGERLVSISLGDITYFASGSSGGWEKMKRAEIIAVSRQAEPDASLTDCRSLGSRSVAGTETVGYGFVLNRKSGRFTPKPSKIWVGPDGFVRLQETGKTTLRYEYDNVRAPIP